MSDELDNVTIPSVEEGVYQHYKGNRYEVVGIALHSETLKPMVIYRPLYETKVAYWARPYDMFFQTVDVNGHEVPRFHRIDTQ